MRKVHDFLTVGAAAPLQEAAVTALEFGPEYYAELQEKYTQLRDFFLSGLTKAGIPHTVPQGAYYVLADVSEFGYESDLEFCELMAEKAGVAAVPASSFFREPVNDFVRFHFAKKESTLNEALDRLMKLREKMPRRS